MARIELKLITLNPIALRGIAAREIGAPVGFTPASLFRAGEQGVWYDPSDLSTMFQDEAKTTPVTAADQPVRVINDKSGNGNHATAPSDAARPMLRAAGGLWYLDFDGVNDSLQATFSAISQPGFSSAGALVGANSSFVPLQDSANTSNRWTLGRNVSTTTPRLYAGVELLGNSGDWDAFNNGVYSSVFNGASSEIRKNLNAKTVGNAGTQTLNGLTLFSRFDQAANWMVGRLYGFVLVGSVVSTENQDRTIKYLADKAGITL